MDKTETIRVRIEKCSITPCWYGFLIGREVAVEDYDKELYRHLNGNRDYILKSDCTILPDEKNLTKQEVIPSLKWEDLKGKKYAIKYNGKDEYERCMAITGYKHELTDVMINYFGAILCDDGNVCVDHYLYGKGYTEISAKQFLSANAPQEAKRAIKVIPDDDGDYSVIDRVLKDNHPQPLEPSGAEEIVRKAMNWEGDYEMCQRACAEYNIKHTVDINEKYANHLYDIEPYVLQELTALIDKRVAEEQDKKAELFAEWLTDRYVPIGNGYYRDGAGIKHRIPDLLASDDFKNFVKQREK